MEELKNCPFCGSAAKLSIDKTYTGHDYEIYCDSCFVTTGVSDVKETVIKIWNNRIDQDFVEIKEY